MGEGLVPRGGKIVLPGEVKNLVGEAGGNLPGAVGRAGVYKNDLVHQVGHTLQTALQHILLVLYDHTQADAYHGQILLLIRQNVAPAGETRRELIFRLC